MWFKRFSIRKGLKKAVKSWIEKTPGEKVIFGYAMTESRMTIMEYAKKLDKNIKTVLIVPDLPQYMNFGKTSKLFRLMKNIDSKIPSNVEKVWDENLKQYYVEYQEDGITYKMWLEEEESIKAKFALMKKYNLAGAAYWQKDFEKPSIWDVVAEEIK